MPLFLAWSLTAAACGGADVDTNEPVRETPLIAPLAAERNEAPAQRAVPGSSTSKVLPGTIRREDLRDILAAGPAGVLAMVRTEPVRDRGTFIGFRIAAFIKGNPSAIDLRAGDVLVAINGQKIVSPDDYLRVFQELSVASELRFDLLRDGTPQTQSYPIIE